MEGLRSSFPPESAVACRIRRSRDSGDARRSRDKRVSEQYRLKREIDSSIVLGFSLARGRWLWYKVKRSRRVWLSRTSTAEAVVVGGDFERFPGLQASGAQETKQTEQWNQRTPNEWMEGKKGRKGEEKRKTARRGK